MPVEPGGLRSYFSRLITGWLIGLIIFIPFTFHLLPFQADWTQFFFGRLVRFTSEQWLHQPMPRAQFISDSLSLYLLAAWLWVLAAGIALLPIAWYPRWCREGGGRQMARSLVTAYLSVVLVRYGLDKIFQTQFYLPEPNILFTPAGQLDKDIFFWSSMGSSRLYNLLTGSAEVMAATLLFFRRTRLAGLLLSVFILLQIVVINFSFDISVKLFSLLLLLMAGWLLREEERGFFRYLFRLPVRQPRPQAAHRPGTTRFIYLFGKILLGGLILLEGFYGYLRGSLPTDQHKDRPYLHGAYEVVARTTAADSATAVVPAVKRFFIHRRNYFILQDGDDTFRDYGLSVDTTNGYFRLTDYDGAVRIVPYRWNATDSLLTLQWRLGQTNLVLSGKSIPWRNMPLLRDGFHWFSDR